MSVGALVVTLGLDAVDFVGGLTKSEQQAKRFAQSVDRDFAAAARALGVIGGGIVAAAGAVGLFVKTQADALDKLNDAADATGSSVEKLSALEDVARRNGSELSTVTDVLVKFNATLKDLDPKGQAAQILEKLGLSAADLKKQDPAEALRQTAAAFAKFADDGTKARNVAELFGKGVRDAAPFLKDLAEQQELVGSQTTETAQEAERFNKNLSEMATAAGDAGRAIANTLIPPINKLFAEAKSDGITKALGLDGVGDKVGQVAAAYELLSLGVRRALVVDTAGSEEKLARIDARARELAKSFTAAREASLGIGSSQAGAGRGFVNPPAAVPLPSMGDTTTTKKDPASEAERFVEGLRKQAQAAEDLSKSEEVLRAIQEGRFKGESQALIDSAKGYAIQVDAAKALEQSFKEAGESNGEWVRKQIESTEAARRAADETEDQNQALRDEIAIINGGEEARRAIEQARVASAISVKEQALSLRQLNGASEVEIQNLEREIALLRERGTLLGQRNSAADEAERLNQQLRETERISGIFRSAFEDAFVDFASGARSAKDVFNAFADDVVRGLLRITAEKAALALFGGEVLPGTAGVGRNSGVFGDALGKLFGLTGFYNQGQFVGPPELATGMDYVPYDGFPAILHRGERVMTASENARGGRGMSVTNHFTVTGPIDRRTQQQIADEAGRSVRRAMARNG